MQIIFFSNDTRIATACNGFFDMSSVFSLFFKAKIRRAKYSNLALLILTSYALQLCVNDFLIYNLHSTRSNVVHPSYPF